MPAKAPTINLDNAIQAYIAGNSIENCAKAFHISEKRLKKALLERGLLRDETTRKMMNRQHLDSIRPPQHLLSIDDIASRYKAGESEKAIAQSFGVDRGVIRRRLQQANIPMRSQTEANRLLAQSRTHEERLNYTLAANIARTGRKDPLERKERRAKTRQEKHLGVSPAELLLQEWLRQRGVETIPQMAVGTYNIDLGTNTDAVEIFGGGWHGYGNHFKRAPERHRYLFDHGFNLIIVWVDGRKWPLSPAAADYVASFIQLTGGDPTIRSQYRVIWGDGKEVPPDRLNLKHLALIPSRRAANNAGT